MQRNAYRSRYWELGVQILFYVISFYISFQWLLFQLEYPSMQLGFSGKHVGWGWKLRKWNQISQLLDKSNHIPYLPEARVCESRAYETPNIGIWVRSQPNNLIRVWTWNICLQGPGLQDPTAWLAEYSPRLGVKEISIPHYTKYLKNSSFILLLKSEFLLK
jgi:hypothetical protein